MQRHGTSLLILTVLLVASACAEPAAETTPYAKKSGSGSATGQSSNSLVLNWNAQTGTTAYHIYFNDPTAQAKDREIDSLQKGAANFASPVLAIDNTNMEAWPSKGSKACFTLLPRTQALSPILRIRLASPYKAWHVLAFKHWFKAKTWNSFAPLFLSKLKPSLVEAITSSVLDPALPIRWVKDFSQTNGLAWLIHSERLFHPLAIFQFLDRGTALDDDLFLETDSLVYHYRLPKTFFARDRATFIERFEAQKKALAEELSRPDALLLLTLGTSVLYSKDEQWVANCHQHRPVFFKDR